MLARILELVSGLRQAGVAVGTAELVDAVEALSAVDHWERDTVYAVLRSALVKEHRYFEVFDYLFEQIFSLPFLVPTAGVENEEGKIVSSELREKMMAALWDEDPRAFYRRLAQELTARYLPRRGPLWFSTFLGVEAVAQRIGRQAGVLPASFRGGSSGGSGGSGSSVGTGQIAAAEELLKAVRQQVAAYRYQHRKEQGLVFPDDEAWRDLPFNQATPEEQRYLKQLVRQLARKIATRPAGVKRQGGKEKINFRRLWRKSLSSGGIPFDLCWEHLPPRKARLFVLLDISRSMNRIVSFFVELLFALHQEFSHIRAFLFVNSLVEVTRFIEREEPGESLNVIVNRGGEGLSGLTDYGEVLEEFCRSYVEELTAKTTVIILGDGRNNYFPTREENLEEIKRRCASVFWLNPEPRWQWGTGDSAMRIYAPFCDGVFECSNLRQLEEFVQELVRKK